MIFTDRSRYVRRLGHCQMAAYYNYHYANVGIVKRGLSVPLATGTYTHLPITTILRKVAGGVATITQDMIASAVVDATKEYKEEIRAKGFADLEDPTTADHIMMEQCFLTEGLAWAWTTEILPRFLEEFIPIAVEQEFEIILGCTCGLSGVGEVALHMSRACKGVVFMTRPDVIAQHTTTISLSYHEIKTGSDVGGDFWGDQFKDNIQSSVGCAAAGRYFDKPIGEFFIHGLHKGQRKSDKVDGERTKLRKQASPFCYAYVRPESAPMIELDIKPYQNWTDADGKGRRCGKLYEKTPVWEISTVLSIHDYLDLLAPDDVGALFKRNVKLVGPYDTNQRLIDQLLAEVLYDEQDWHNKIALIRTAVGETGSESHDEVLGLLTELIPRSWECRGYFGRDCEYKPICFKHEGWDYPTENKVYELREANHPIERMNGLWEREV